MQKKIKSKPVFFATAAVITLSSLLFALMLLNGSKTYAQASFPAGTPSYFPMVVKMPTPTATAVPVEPEFVKNISLPAAKCPSYVNVNNTSGYAYVLNNFSHDIAIFKNADYVTTVQSGGEWPTKAVSDPASNRTWVTNIHRLSGAGQTTTQLGMFEDTDHIANYDQFFEGHTPLYNTVNKYLYVTDLGQTIRVFDASGGGLQFLADISMDQGIEGWITSITYDPVSGLVFAASWSDAEIYVIDGTTLVTTLPSNTWGPASLAIDSVNRQLYIVGQEVDQRPENYPANNVVIKSIDPPFAEVAAFAITTSSTGVAYDSVGGYLYVINPDADSVSIFKDAAYIQTLPVGDFPRDVEVHPQTGYAFVTNFESDDISVLKDGQAVKTINSQGVGPVSVDFDLLNNYVYVANRGTEPKLFECKKASVTVLR